MLILQLIAVPEESHLKVSKKRAGKDQLTEEQKQ